MARVNSPLPRPLVSSFGAISSWQPGNTSFSMARLPGSRPGVAGWGSETPPSPSRASSASRQGAAAAAASPASARPRTGGRSGPVPRCPRRQGAAARQDALLAAGARRPAARPGSPSGLAPGHADPAWAAAASCGPRPACRAGPLSVSPLVGGNLLEVGAAAL